jgi:hypothetical protein
MQQPHGISGMIHTQLHSYGVRCMHADTAVRLTQQCAMFKMEHHSRCYLDAAATGCDSA